MLAFSYGWPYWLNFASYGPALYSALILLCASDITAEYLILLTAFICKYTAIAA